MNPGESDPAREEIIKARGTAVAAGAVTLALAILKAFAGSLSGSTALSADALHSASDLLALGASWFGLHLATKRRTDRFPYGLDRVETLAVDGELHFAFRKTVLFIFRSLPLQYPGEATPMS